jgi:hypothetical protein
MRDRPENVRCPALVRAARLYQDEQRHLNAAHYHSLTMPELERPDVAQSDPIALAYGLDDDASALAEAGDKEASDKIRSQVKGPRLANPDRKADFKALQFAKLCPLAPLRSEAWPGSRAVSKAAAVGGVAVHPPASPGRLTC